jgi:hypothetical protein
MKIKIAYSYKIKVMMKMERNFSNSTKYNVWERILRESLEANSEELKRGIKETRRYKEYLEFLNTSSKFWRKR